MLLEIVFRDHREWLEQSVVVQDWLRIGREQGLVQGLLSSRFGGVDASLESAINRIEEQQRLQELITKAAVVPSLDQFAREILS